MAIVSKGELRTILKRSVPRLQSPASLPTGDKEQRIQQSLKNLVERSLKELGQ